MHVSVSGLRAQKSTFFGPGPALDFSRNGLRKLLLSNISPTLKTSQKPSPKWNEQNDNLLRVRRNQRQLLFIVQWRVLDLFISSHHITGRQIHSFSRCSSPSRFSVQRPAQFLCPSASVLFVCVMTSRKSTQRTSAAAGDIPPTPVTDLEEDDSSSEDEEILDGICATDSLRYMARKQKGDGASTAATGAGAGNAPTATGTTRGGRNHRGGTNAHDRGDNATSASPTRGRGGNHSGHHDDDDLDSMRSHEILEEMYATDSFKHQERRMRDGTAAGGRSGGTGNASTGPSSSSSSGRRSTGGGSSSSRSSLRDGDRRGVRGDGLRSIDEMRSAQNLLEGLRSFRLERDAERDAQRQTEQQGTASSTGSGAAGGRGGGGGGGSGGSSGRSSR